MTSTRRCAVAFLISLTALTLHCKRKAAIPPDVIARVGERFLTLGGFKRYLERNAGTDLSQLTQEVSSAMLDQYIEEILLSEYAASHNIEVPAEQIATLVRSEPGATIIEKRDEMRRQKLVTERSAQVPDPSEAELRAYYDQHLSEFRSDEELRVKQILVHDEPLANEITRNLKRGASFEDLSTRHSRAPNAKRGGEIGYVSRGELPKMFEDEIFRLRPGETSSVIRTDAGFHIFKVEERRPAGTLDYGSSAPLIRERLRDEALRGQMAQVAAKARGDFPAAILTKRLSFKYSGTFSRSENE